MDSEALKTWRKGQRKRLIEIADKCPVHKLMTLATTEVRTELANATG